MREGRAAPRLTRSVAAAGLVALVLTVGACSGPSDEGATTDSTPIDSTPASTGATGTTEAGPRAAELCDAVGGSAGTVERDGLDETSGLVASRTLPDVLWAHDDSGGEAAVYAVGLDGTDRGRAQVSGVEQVDWEDIALVPGTGGGPDRILIADIGDNLGVTRGAEPILLVRIDEPSAPVGEAGRPADATVIRLAYPDGPRDAEALLVDPTTGDAFVVSKQWDGAEAGLYRVPAERVAGAEVSTPVPMERVGSVAGTTASLVTGGDISADGRAIVLRTYADVRVWDRSEGATVAEALSVAPLCSVAVEEPQGEAVAVLADGSGFVTVSEGENPDVLVFRAP